MSVHIGEVATTVETTDQGTMLSPEAMRAVVLAVVHELEARAARERRRASDEKLARTARRTHAEGHDD